MNALLNTISLALFFTVASSQLYRWESERFKSPSYPEAVSGGGRDQRGQGTSFVALRQPLQNERNLESHRPRSNSRGNEGSRTREGYEQTENIKVIAVRRGLDEFSKVKRLDDPAITIEKIGELESLITFLLKGGSGGKGNPGGEKGALALKSKMGGGKQSTSGQSLGNFGILESLKGIQGIKIPGNTGNSGSPGQFSQKGLSGIGKDPKQGYGSIQGLSGLKQKEIGKMGKSAPEVGKTNPFAFPSKGFPSLGSLSGKKEGPAGLEKLLPLILKGNLGEKGGSGSSGAKPKGVKGSLPSLAGFGSQGTPKPLGGLLLPKLGLLNHAIIVKSYPILSHDWW